MQICTKMRIEYVKNLKKVQICTKFVINIWWFQKKVVPLQRQKTKS